MTDPYEPDAPFYDLVHEGYEQDIGLWQALAGRTDRPVLEVGCGTGRVAVPLAQAGVRVVGLDPSAVMLRIARERADAAGVKVDWRHGTIQEADVEPGTYGLVLMANDTFLHCADGDEQVAWLEACARALDFNGVLAVDLPGPALWLDPSGDSQPLVMASEQQPDGSWIDVIHVRQDDLGAQVRRLLITYERTAPDGTVMRTRSEHQLRYVYRFEMEYLLAMSGLALLDVYGDYDLGPLTNTSERMIVTARRTQG